MSSNKNNELTTYFRGIMKGYISHICWDISRAKDFPHLAVWEKTADDEEEIKEISMTECADYFQHIDRTSPLYIPITLTVDWKAVGDIIKESLRECRADMEKAIIS